ncbi:dNA-binding helix-turn-helix protein [Firmicutes bacterium CAG:170]|jgi:transcriptional regulator with XRE-family HTH domain|nr:dNA-binding helix-turn-helix protein [Firmicutes bacterium CAG:170]
MTLKDLVIKYRADNGLSQRQFALQCGLSNGYISMLEKGINPSTGAKITPTLQALNKLAAGMHTTLNELFTLVDDMDVDVKTPALSEEDGLASVDMEIISLLAGLSDAKKQQAISFLRFLAASEET